MSLSLDQLTSGKSDVMFVCTEDYARALQKDRGIPRPKRRCSLQPRQTSGENLPSVSSSSVLTAEMQLSTHRQMTATDGEVLVCTEVQFDCGCEPLHHYCPSGEVLLEKTGTEYVNHNVRNLNATLLYNNVLQAVSYRQQLTDSFIAKCRCFIGPWNYRKAI